MYLDTDYCIKNKSVGVLSEDYEVKDIYFIRKPHYSEITKEYWENKQDESIYLKVKSEESDIERAILLAKNEVSEYEIYFDDELQKQVFYKQKQQKEFYNHLTIYSLLTDKQVTQLLNIMSQNIDCYDYNFQYCDQDIVIKNIISNNLQNESVVTTEYQFYLEKSNQVKQENDLETMLEKNTDSNIISFNSRSSK